MENIDKSLGFWTTLRADLDVLTVRNSSYVTMFFCLLSRPGFLAVFIYRLAAKCVHKGVPGKLLASFLTRLNNFINNCDINPRAVIGPAFKMPHPSGIVIGPATVGHHVMILQNVALGMRHFTDDESDPKNYPIIGDHVIISANAVVVGGIRVGNHTLVGANAVVIHDVPENVTVVGAPAHIVNSHRNIAVA